MNFGIGGFSKAYRREFPIILATYYAQWGLVINPTPSANTLVSGMTVTFTLAVPTLCRVTTSMKGRVFNGKGVQAYIYDGDTQISSGSWGGTYSLSRGAAPENNNNQLHLDEIFQLGAGTHTINVRILQTGGADYSDWFDRMIVVEAIG